MYRIHKRIYIVGFMGAGKSTVGRNLAEHLGFDFLDLDDYIEEQSKMTIADIFKTQGEDYFRAQETDALHQLLYRLPVVVSLGGGTPCFNDNMKLINHTGTSVYLKMSVEEVVNRLKNEKAHRPVISEAKSESDLKKLISEKLEVRKKFYEEAMYTVDGEQSVSEIIDEIIDLINS